MSANLISLKFEGRVKKAVQNVSRANEPRDQPTGTHSYSYRVDFFFFSFFFNKSMEMSQDESGVEE